MTPDTESRSTRPIAYFDFDGTLTRGDTLMPFIKYVVGKPIYYAKLAIVSPVLFAYAIKLLRNDVAKQFVLKKYLAGYRSDELAEYGKRFSEEVIPGMLRPEGMARLKWHQKQGHDCVLVSASIDLYLTAWANSEQFSYVICTTLEQSEEGHISGNIQNQNCYGQEKKRRIYEWQAKKNPTETYAYGDTSGDLPMLHAVKYGKIWNRIENDFISVS